MFYSSMGIQSTFTKNGNRLAAKMLSEAVTKSNPSIRHLENIPAEAKTFDLAVIERKFGKELIGVFSFRDKNGKLIKRIQEIQGDKKLVTTSDYFYSENTREIVRKTKENNKLIKEVFDNISTSLSGMFKKKYSVSKTSLTREVVNDSNIKSNERHLFGFFESKVNPKKLIAKVQRNQDNSVTTKGFQYAGITKDEAKELAKDPYLTMRLLPMDDFMSALKYKVYINQDINRTPIKTYKASLGSSASSDIAHAIRDEHGTIYILLNKQKDAIKVKPKVVNSLNHEAKHCRQYISAEQLEYTQYYPVFSVNPNVRTRQKVYGRLNDEKSIEYAKSMQKAMENYTFEGPGYYNNPMEVEARAVGEGAANEYNMYADKLKSKIALTPKQLGLLD